jgi:isochorismate hydrolase
MSNSIITYIAIMYCTVIGFKDSQLLYTLMNFELCVMIVCVLHHHLAFSITKCDAMRSDVNVFHLTLVHSIGTCVGNIMIE